MHASDDRLIFSATDLSNFLACPQLTLLGRLTALGGPKPPQYDDPGADVLRQRGLDHEQAYLQELVDRGLNVVRIPEPGPGLHPADRWRRLADQTERAMRAGAEVIYQGALFDGTWLGRPDFLLRVETPSDLGAHSYEVVDAKLARSAKGGAVLQLCVYSDLLTQLQGTQPEHMVLALGGGEEPERFRYADFAAYYRSVRSRFLAHLGRAEAGASMPHAPDPVEHCHLCDWKTRCDAERRDVDHLALVADITRRERRALEGRGITTLAGLARLDLPLDPPLQNVGAPTRGRLHEQARIQLEGREAGDHRYELFEDVKPDEGLAALPEPSPGDLFFDIEGDPYALGDGIEYLFGLVDTGGGYSALWALDRAGEEAAFEEFMDLVAERLERYPDLHIYHYGHYEPTHLKQLVGRHATREDELDGLLRGKVFVDLHRVVRQSLRASVESYSIKKLEPVYGFEREVNLRDANRALAHFEAWLELGGAGEDGRELLDSIQGYNRDDCVSTLRLREWLEGRRVELERVTGAPVPRASPADQRPTETVASEGEEIERLKAELTADLPADESRLTEEQRAKLLLSRLLGYYRREDKSTWWEYFRCLELSDEEEVDDRAALGGLEYEGVVDAIKRSYVHRYRFQPQDHRIKVGGHVRDSATEGSPGSVEAIDDLRGTIDLKRGKSSTVPHPRGLIPYDFVGAEAQRESLKRLAEATIAHGSSDDHPNRAAVDILMRRRPAAGQAEDEPVRRPDEPTLDCARRLAIALDRSVLPIQGPPGSGKTYTGARMILALLEAGKRVGVTATSHKVIGNLLEAACDAARESGVEIRGVQKADDDQRCGAGEIEHSSDYGEIREALAAGEMGLAAGTAWMWARPEFADAVDVLFIDEAGQFSLADALAVAQAGRSMVLLGDPRQLERPQQGVHPPGADVSALDHLLGEEVTVPPDRGLFLDRTWRLHPTICAFTSKIFYRGRLSSQDGRERQAVRGSAPLNGSGLRLVPVEHAGNQSESPEEVGVVGRLVRSALDAGATWIDVDGTTRPLGVDDILVVAPYNAQVSALLAALPDGARVGTVDKFQGQEAPIVIYSVTTSSAEDAPRGMDFLYSPNRLNVATSRARCLAVVVANPAVLVPECRTPKQMRLANAFARYREVAAEP